MMGKSTPERCEHCDSTKFFDLLCHECDEVPVPREALWGLLNHMGVPADNYDEWLEMDRLRDRVKKRLGETDGRD